jgi:Domain of unknown function (DUF4375)
MPAAADAGDRYWELISPHWLPLNETWDLGVDVFLTETKKLPRRVVDLYSAHWCQSEVNNGGFYQFFSNTTGLLAPEAVAAFQAIGLVEWAALLREAMAYFPTPYPRERGVRLGLLPEPDARKREFWDPFTAFDDSFYDCVDGQHRRWEEAADAYAMAVV